MNIPLLISLASFMGDHWSMQSIAPRRSMQSPPSNQRQVRKDRRRAHAAGKKNAFA